MIPAKLRKVAYASIALKGLVAAVAPRLSARLAVTMSLPGFENTGELEPTDWYVRAVRATGVGMLAAGGTALLLESRAEATTGDEPSDGDSFDGIDRIDSTADDSAGGAAANVEGVDVIGEDSEDSGASEDDSDGESTDE